MTTAIAPPLGRRNLTPNAAKLVMGVAAVATFILALLSPSPLIVIASGITLVAIIAMLWIGKDLPVLLFPVAYQWSEISTKPMMTAFSGRPLDEYSQYGASLQGGVYLGLFAILALAIGMRLGGGVPRANYAHMVRQAAARTSQRRVLLISLSAILGGHAINWLTAFAGSFRQPLLALSQVELAGVFILAYWCFVHRRSYLLLAAVLLVEIIIGMTGFFAGFRGPVLMVLLALIAARPRLRLADLFVAAIVGSIVISAAVFWTDVKSGYRQFVNGGTNQQVVLAPLDQRISYLSEEATRFTLDQYEDSFQNLLLRHSYIDFTSQTLAYVPSVVPHENGSRIGASFLHILTPRFLFPDKAPLPSDTVVTAYYTGLNVGSGRGTSISLGYLAELYIDFGYVGACIATFALGIGAGLLYRVLQSRAAFAPLVTYGLAAMWALTLAAFGAALIKLISAVILAFAAALLCQRVIWPIVRTNLRMNVRRANRS